MFNVLQRCVDSTKCRKFLERLNLASQLVDALLDWSFWSKLVGCVLEGIAGCPRHLLLSYFQTAHAARNNLVIVI